MEFLETGNFIDKKFMIVQINPVNPIFLLISQASAYDIFTQL